jgi:hypothetical protein
VLNILGDYHGNAVAVFTIIMESRSVALYRKVLDLLKSVFPEFQPKQLMADYEAAMRKAVKVTFPTTRLYGCR